MASKTAVLSKLIQDKVHVYMQGCYDYGGPLSAKNPSYYIEFCTAVATGISDGSKVINFVTSDAGVGGAPPVPGTGTGIGVFVDKAWFHENLYTEILAKIKSTFGRTLHDPFPPGPENSGRFLDALCKGISDSVEEHFKTAYTLTSAHPLVYMGAGLINEGMYSGLQPNNIASLIKAAGPRLKGKFFPIMIQAVAEVYVKLIHEHSTGKVVISGVCVPSPTPPQACGINMVGAGTGTAI